MPSAVITRFIFLRRRGDFLADRLHQHLRTLDDDAEHEFLCNLPAVVTFLCSQPLLAGDVNLRLSFMLFADEFYLALLWGNPVMIELDMDGLHYGEHFLQACYEQIGVDLRGRQRDDDTLVQFVAACEYTWPYYRRDPPTLQAPYVGDDFGCIPEFYR